MIQFINWTRFQQGSYSFNIPAILSLLSTPWTNIMSSAMHYLARWKYMAWSFFLSWDSENESFLYTYYLSQKIFADPSIYTPTILNLYLNETIKSTAIQKDRLFALCIYIYLKICKDCTRCIVLGNSRYLDKADTSNEISIHPRFMIHLSTTTRFW